jgi:transcription initiation factor IIF auxiliary subunit
VTRLPVLRLLLPFLCCSLLWGQNIALDNTAQYIGDGRYSWTVFLKGDTSQVASVQYTLHPTFPEPVVWGKGSNYAFSANGWGEFNIVARVYFKDKKKQPTIINYWLRLFSTQRGKR